MSRMEPHHFPHLDIALGVPHCCRDWFQQRGETTDCVVEAGLQRAELESSVCRHLPGMVAWGEGASERRKAEPGSF